MNLSWVRRILKSGKIKNRPTTHDRGRRFRMGRFLLSVGFCTQEGTDPSDRIYTLSEVSRILYESELRPRPATGMPGHALGQHGELRDDITDKRFKPVILLAATLEETRAMRPEDGIGTPAPHKLKPKDGKFLSRKDVIKAVHEALNSPGRPAGTEEAQRNRELGQDRSEACLEPGESARPSVSIPTINTGTKKMPKLGLLARIRLGLS